MKECVRAVWPFIKNGLVLVLVARQSAVESPFDKLSSDIVGLLSKAGALDRETKSGV